MAAYALDVLDWRRRVHAIYAQVRADPDPARAHAAWADARDRLIRTHPASPIPPDERAGHPAVHHAPYDPALRFHARVDTHVPAHRMEVPTTTDGVVPFERIGRVHLALGDLDVWWLDSYGGGIFVPVKDRLAGRLTYGGGRYLLDTVKGADLGGSIEDGLVIDLNFAYNPSCAYDSQWSCPLAPPGNTVAADLEAGELMAP